MPHKYINYVQLSSEHADKWRKYCICTSCKEKLGYDTALLNKIPNKSERISAHLKKCSNFKIMHPEKYNEFFGSINLNSRDLEQSNAFFILFVLVINYYMHLIYIKIFSIASSSNSSISTKGTLDSFVVCPMSKNDVSIFEKLLIRATVSAGWSLQSVENKEVNELFSFINPTIKLPGRQALGGRILNNEVKSLQLQLENKIKNDPVGVTLC